MTRPEIAPPVSQNAVIRSSQNDLVWVRLSCRYWRSDPAPISDLLDIVTGTFSYSGATVVGELLRRDPPGANARREPGTLAGNPERTPSVAPRRAAPRADERRPAPTSVAPPRRASR